MTEDSGSVDWQAYVEAWEALWAILRADPSVRVPVGDIETRQWDEDG